MNNSAIIDGKSRVTPLVPVVPVNNSFNLNLPKEKPEIDSSNQKVIKELENLKKALLEEKDKC